ncbi:unnamed protein product [Dicrocoelium dendriticum]|nr:unnamed protein product [Dicrocoelium dendriticum]
MTGNPSGIDFVEDTVNDLTESLKQMDDVSDLICSLRRTAVSEADDDELASELSNILRSSDPESSASVTTRSLPDALDASLNETRLDGLTLPETIQISRLPILFHIRYALDFQCFLRRLCRLDNLVTLLVSLRRIAVW